MENGINLDLSMGKKVLFPYVYLDEMIQKSDQFDEPFYLYYVLLGDRKRAVRKKCDQDYVYIDVRNYSSDDENTYLFPLNDEDGFRDVEILDSGSLLKLSCPNHAEPKFWHVATLPGKNGARVCNEFEVLYIGKSGTREQKMSGRLLNHQKIAEIHRDIDKRSSKKELYILVTGLKSEFIFVDIPFSEMKTTWEKRAYGDVEKSCKDRENEEIGIAEALLINTFKPKYNKCYKGDESLGRSKFFEQCVRHGIASVAYSLDLSLIDGSYMKLFTSDVMTNTRCAIIQCSVSSRGEGNIEFKNLPDLIC